MRVLLDSETIGRRVRALGKQLEADYAGCRPVFIGLLKGSFVFLADLSRAVDLPLEIDFLGIASYGNQTEPGAVRLTKDLAGDITGRHVLIVEDICDTGQSLVAACAILRARGAASVRTCLLLDKPERRQVAFVPDYVGFEIPDVFVVGYGLDFAERFRNLPWVGICEEADRADPAPAR
ncbi:MAG: hypoxanthine phosphoribosyltransferase [Bacillota bacterium]|nr:hypoxanthine phosphoribosyltransferase [Bacillota bacterium]